MQMYSGCLSMECVVLSILFNSITVIIIPKYRIYFQKKVSYLRFSTTFPLGDVN